MPDMIHAWQSPFAPKPSARFSYSHSPTVDMTSYTKRCMACLKVKRKLSKTFMCALISLHGLISVCVVGYVNYRYRYVFLYSDVIGPTSCLTIIYHSSKHLQPYKIISYLTIKHVLTKSWTFLSFCRNFFLHVQLCCLLNIWLTINNIIPFYREFYGEFSVDRAWVLFLQD